MKALQKLKAVLTVLKKIDENIPHQDIDVVHRLGKSKKTKPPTSLSDISPEKPETQYLMLMLENLPPNVFSSMKTLSKKKQLFYLANDKRKRFGWKYIWTNNGRIHLRQNNDSKAIIIRHEKDLEQIEKPTADSGNL